MLATSATPAMSDVVAVWEESNAVDVYTSDDFVQDCYVSYLQDIDCHQVMSSTLTIFAATSDGDEM